MSAHSRRTRRGFSWLEFLAIVAILGLIVAILVPRARIASEREVRRNDAHNKAKISAEVTRWYIEKGAWPLNDLSDIGADAKFFPGGLPTNPVSGRAYTWDPASQRVQ